MAFQTILKFFLFMAADKYQSTDYDYNTKNSFYNAPKQLKKQIYVFIIVMLITFVHYQILCEHILGYTAFGIGVPFIYCRTRAESVCLFN